VSTRGALPDPLKLRRHLDFATAAELDEFVRFWGPHEKPTNGRGDLVERLHRLMSDENVVYGKVDLLSEKVRAVLLRLLRKTHYVSDLQGLFRGADGLEMEYYEAEAALTALARRGFVRVSRGQDWLHYGRAAYAIPQETALVLRGLAGGDRRPLRQVFSHATYRPAAGDANGPPPPLPASVGAALDALPGALKEAVREAVVRYGGILTRHEFAERLGEKGVRWESVRFLQELGKRGLGTVGHLDLRTKGIGADDDAIFVFAEAVERHVAERRAEPLIHDSVVTAHGDLLSDVRAALDLVREEGVKVAKEGAVYKTSRARVAERLQFPVQPLLDREEVADRVLALARALGLAASNGDGQLAVTGRAEEWALRPLLERIEEARDLLLRGGSETLRSYHLRRIEPLLTSLLAEDGEWWPGTSVALLARNRYLLALDAEEAPPGRPPLAVRHGAATELGRAVEDLLLKDLFSLGLVDIALRGVEVAGVRLSRLGRRLLLREPEVPAARTKPLIVNPDFEMLVLPEGDVDDLLLRLDRIAVRERTGEVVHCRLDRARVERAAVDGTTPDEIVALLTKYARAELPQNVVYTIRSWCENVRSASLEAGVLFVASDPAVVQAVLAHPLLRGFVARVVDDKTLFFREQVLERAAVQELRALGVHVRG
jgi:Helicase conserved C-terminal domain